MVRRVGNFYSTVVNYFSRVLTKHSKGSKNVQEISEEEVNPTESERILRETHPTSEPEVKEDDIEEKEMLYLMRELWKDEIHT